MCRLLVAKSKTPFAVEPYLRSLAEVAQSSKEYQGHGWGYAVLDDRNEWAVQTNIKPIWEDDLDRLSETRLLIAHARSAFRNEGITVENNMPFCDDRYAFAFNGELRGVRIQEEGRIGAEKIFNFIKRFDRGNLAAATIRATEIIRKRTEFIRAMNIVIADRHTVCVSSLFNDDPDYFTMHRKSIADGFVVCSQPFGPADDWTPIANDSIQVLT